MALQVRIPESIKSSIDLEKKPDDLQISTMTIVCRINVLFHIPFISNFIDLDESNICEIKSGKKNKKNVDEESLNRTLKKRKTKCKRKYKKSNFYNQVTLVVKTSNLIRQDKTINIKLFNNGTIHITGAKSIEETLIGIDKIFKELKKERGYLDFKNNTYNPIKLVDDIDKLNIDNLYDYSIEMINSNFSIGYRVNRDNLYDMIKNAKCDNIKLECSYDPIKHAGVDIKYCKDGEIKIITIFVFESGSIIITGAKKCQQILDAYNFITVFMISNYKKLVKK